MSIRTIGTCSLCGGPVQVPLIWGGIIPPTPTCGDCGATAKEPHGPVIPMKEPPARTSSTTDELNLYTERNKNLPDPLVPLFNTTGVPV